jgi:plastocyanin
VSVGDDFFSPAATTVTAGTTVTWTWKGSISHNVTFDDGTASATQSSGTFSRVFNTAGTYPYHCTIHGTAMSGSVTVQ